MHPIGKVLNFFEYLHKVKPDIIVNSPGKINILGDYNDYCGGWIMPVALDLGTWIGLKKRNDEQVVLHSMEMEEEVSFDLNDLNVDNNGSKWGDYARGVGWALLEAGYPVHGWNGVASSNIPVGAGLSSSSSFIVGVAKAFEAVAGAHWDTDIVASICQRAENDWVGSSSGIIDHFTSTLAKPGQALLLNTKNSIHKRIKIPDEISLVLLDTSVRRQIVNSTFNLRYEEIRHATDALGLEMLCDISPTDFDIRINQLSPNLGMRARHVISENERVKNAAKCILDKKFDELGTILNESHMSMVQDFECSTRELNIIVEIAQRTDGCYGSRISGEGFGGCALAIVKKDMTISFSDDVANEYQHQTGLQPWIHVISVQNGSH